jgi:penicillin-binding protein 1A
MMNKAQHTTDRRMRKSPTDRNYFKIFLVSGACVAGIALLALSGYVLFLMATLPKVDRLADYRPPIVTQVFGDNGILVGEFYLERRIVVPVDKIPGS